MRSFQNFFFNVLTTTTLLVITLTSCSTEPIAAPTVTKQYSQADRRVWVHLAEFEQQAKKRGLSYDLAAADLVVSIDTINHNHVAGLCNYNSDAPNEIVIDVAYWNKVDRSRRELILFHELGHCLLKRSHNNEHDGTGICASIMRSGTGSCLDSYDADSRANYLDELFDPQ